MVSDVNFRFLTGHWVCFDRKVLVGFLKIIVIVVMYLVILRMIIRIKDKCRLIRLSMLQLLSGLCVLVVIILISIVVFIITCRYHNQRCYYPLQYYA